MAEKCTFENIRSKNLLIYEYIRGSEAYGTKIPDGLLLKAHSDIDTAGVFAIPFNSLIGMNDYYTDIIADEKNDNVWYELGKWFKLLIASNPNILESLWIPERCILYESPIMSEIKNHRDKFLSKIIYETFGGYARSQIKKARGLNKAIVNPVKEHLTPLDFCYTFYKQGSTKIENFLSYRGLKQRYCGLVNIPNMQYVYHVFYDYYTHIEVEYGGKDKFNDLIISLAENQNIQFNLEKYSKGEDTSQTADELLKFIYSFFITYKGLSISEFINLLVDNKLIDVINNGYCFGFRGILNVDETSNELRLANVPKEEKALCQISYNRFGYEKHCGDYKRYTTWVKERNPNRYELNKELEFDGKNMLHMFRLIHMCTEILNGEGVNIDRIGIDSDFLIDVRLGKYKYSELMEFLSEDSKKMDEAYKNTSLQDSPNIEEINDLLLYVRKKIYQL